MQCLYVVDAGEELIGSTLDLFLYVCTRFHLSILALSQMPDLLKLPWCHVYMSTQEWNRKGVICMWLVSEAQILHTIVYSAVQWTYHTPFNTEMSIGEMKRVLLFRIL